MKTLLLPDDYATGAVFSLCRTWRYSLWRRWKAKEAARMCAVIGLNPSTADETLDDPTIRRCINFARAWGYDGLYMLNAYAFRATDPKDMQAAENPVGPDNDRFIAEVTAASELVLAAWGVHCQTSRANRVCELVNKPIFCLGKTKAGCPKHPLYIRADTMPTLFWQPTTT